MRNVEHGRTLGPYVADHLEKRLRLNRRQRRRRLIEDDDAVGHEKRSRDLHELPLRNRKIANDGIRIELHTKVKDCPACARIHGAVDEDRERQAVEDLLMHQNDAAPLGVHRTGERKRRTVNLECPCGRCQVASQDLHQRRFPGAVLADDGMHLAPTDRQRNILQHLDRAKGLAEPLSPQQRRRLALADGLLGAHAILVQTFPFADDLTAASMNCMPASPSLTVGYKTSESGFRPSRAVRMARAASV